MSTVKKIKKAFSNPRDPRKKRYRKENIAEHSHNRELQIERTSIHTGTRVMFYKKGCEFCKQWKEVIPYINKRLDPRYQSIEMVDIKSHNPQIQYLKPDAAPELYLDGIVVKGITIKEFGVGFLEKYLEEELVI